MRRARMGARAKGPMRHAVILLVLVGMGGAAHAGPPRHRVVIDAGHGGQNMGAVGPYGVHEKYVTLSVALRLGRLLEAEPDVTVFYTRKDDVFVGLSERAEVANAVEADAFVSIHCNADPAGQARGIETFYLGATGSDAAADEVARRENEAGPSPGQDTVLAGILQDIGRNGSLAESAALAEGVLASLRRAFPTTPSRDVRQAAFTVLQRARVPAIVVEIGFITHPEEGLDLLRAPVQERMALALRDAVLAHLRSAAPRAVSVGAGF